MCGIFGWNSNCFEADMNELRLNEIADSLKHRGPDDYSTYVDEDFSLGMVRLAINDLSPLGRQPMQKEKVVLVFNGEIYNFKELKERLQVKGVRFIGDSDTEVLLEAYLAFGLDCIEMLEGMFALAIWDKRIKTIYLARDAFGEKPLYYYHTHENLFFSSELGPLRSTFGRKLTKNPNYLYEYLSYGYSISGHTPFQEVCLLAPGYVYGFQNGKMVSKVKFDYIKSVREEMSFEDSTSRVEQLLFQSVEKQLTTSDVPVAVLLSGGLDSSLIAKIALEIDPDVSLFTMGFADERYDETSLARERFDGVSRHFFLQTNFSIEKIESALKGLDIPLADSSVVPMYLISEAVSDSFKVALTGDGGDELFLGYSTYVASLIAKRIHLDPSFHSLVELAKKFIPVTQGNVTNSYKMRSFLDGLSEPNLFLRHLGWRRIFKKEEINRLLGFEWNGDSVNGNLDIKVGDLSRRLQEIDLRTWLCSDILVKTDRMSMANSLELRSPFLNRQLRDFALALPREYKMHRLQGKRILKVVYERRYGKFDKFYRKRGFGSPVSGWIFQNPDWFTSSIDSCGVFSRTFIEQLMQDHLNKRQDNSYKIFALLSYAKWLEK